LMHAVTVEWEICLCGCLRKSLWPCSFHGLNTPPEMIMFKDKYLPYKAPGKQADFLNLHRTVKII
jgi:hypothetical protein